MRTRMRAGLRNLASASLLGVSICLLSFAASASPETLKRAVANMVLSPLDLMTSPVVGGKLVYEGLRDIEDTRGVRVAYTIPGYIWATGTNAGASLLRTATGMIEFLPGLFLYPFEADLDPLMDPIERGEGLVEIETPVAEIKFGINFQHAAY